MIRALLAPLLLLLLSPSFCFAQYTWDENWKREGDCVIVERQPENPAFTVKGGDNHRLQYQSGRGDGCVVYRVRNTSNMPATALMWYEGTGIIKRLFGLELVAKTSLPPVTDGEPAFVKIKKWGKSYKVKSGETTLGFGVSGDNYKDTPKAFIRDASAVEVALDGDTHDTRGRGSQELAMLVAPFVAGRSGPLPALITEVSGVVVGAKGEPFEFKVRVESKVTRVGRGFDITYTLKSDSEVGTLSVLRSNERMSDPRKPRLVWGPTANEQFLRALDKKYPTARCATGRREVVALPKKVVVKVHTNNVKVVESVLNVIQEGESIFETSALGYVPD